MENPAAAFLSSFRRPQATTDHHHQKQVIGGLILPPLMESPDPDQEEGGDQARKRSSKGGGNGGLGQRLRGHFSRNPPVAAGKRSEVWLMISVMGSPLAPIRLGSSDPLPLPTVKDTPTATSSARYILHQFVAASGGLKLLNTITNAYAVGKLKMLKADCEDATKPRKKRSYSAQKGSFVLWQMNPDMWYVELATGSSKIHAGSNGKLVWRYTPWLGAHAAKGPVRPLRRSLQGLDPRRTASLFSKATCDGEKDINGEACFILKLSVDPNTLKDRSEGPAEVIRHVMFGYFSQKTGLLIRIKDSHLTRIQSNDGDAVYWETTITSALEDYRSVNGIMIAHSGQSVATLFRFGEASMSHSRTRMDENWTIEEVAFNVPGLSSDFFIPPADLGSDSIGESHDLLLPFVRTKSVGSRSAKVAALD